MELNDYQIKTMDTAIYKDAGTGSDSELNYLALGLTSEAGEVAGKVKKLYRDGKLDIGALIYEIGDVFWYLARLCDACGYEAEDVIEINYKKLLRRRDASTLTGSGDNR